VAGNVPGMHPVAARPGLRHVALATVLGLLAAACSGGGDDRPPDVDALLADAAMVMGEVTGVRFEISLAGAFLAIDEDGLLGFRHAEGRYEAPASADALITVDAGGFVTEVGAVIVDGTTWLTNPITGRWEVLPDGLGFDPTEIFDPSIGMRPLLSTDLTGVSYVGREDRDGADTYHLRGTAAAARIEVITGGLVRDQDVTLDFWLNTDDTTVVAAEFSNDTDGGPAEWTLSFEDYGADVDVEPPDTDDGS
jgi:hypothetical protein